MPSGPLIGWSVRDGHKSAIEDGDQACPAVDACAPCTRDEHYPDAMTDRARLDQLTDRWRARHDARRPGADDRPPAEPDREALAATAFPFRTETPAAYVAAHGANMIGFTYDEARYADPELDAWLLEVGFLLRRDR
jgi:hypothetical protein